MSKIVVKIQLLTIEINKSLSQQFLYFFHSPFVPTNTLVAERLEKSSETRRILLWQKDWKSHRKLNVFQR